ncbi:MAG: hypothetical protein ABS54_11365 [Hyphomicrobium sp. SCN 65-11]|nr:MAG: hypothetical protein ABS54_11365 [Hyphomicrobium sp. SCN 65-11]
MNSSDRHAVRRCWFIDVDVERVWPLAMSVRAMVLTFRIGRAHHSAMGERLPRAYSGLADNGSDAVDLARPEGAQLAGAVMERAVFAARLDDKRNVPALSSHACGRQRGCL